MTNEEAIEILSDVGDINRCCAEDAEALDMAIKALEQESKIGHWIVNKEKSLARCSNCKFLLKNKDEIKLFGTFIQGYNYCPYCGYRMIEPQESEGKDGNTM